MVEQAGFGLPTLGTVPYGAMEAMYPYLTYLPNLTSQLAALQYGGQTDLQRAQIAANAATAGDAMRAQATVGAAQIGAGATVESQLIQTKGMLKATQASLMADLEKARNGDIAAAQRYQAGLTQEANLKNQATVLELSKMMGSGQLRDNIGARLALRGMGQMPGISSALNGMENRLWVNAPNVEMPPMYNAPKIDMGGLGGGGNYGGGSNAPSFNFSGGGGGSVSAPNIGSLYGDLFKQVKDSVSFGDIFKFGAPQPPAPTPPSSVDALMAMKAGDPAKAQALLKQVVGLPAAAKGGTFGRGQKVLVGEEGPEVLDIGPNSVNVIPLDGAAADGGAFGYRPAAGEEYIDPNRPYLGVRPSANPIATGGLGAKPATPLGEEYIDPNRPQLGFKSVANPIPTGGLGPKPSAEAPAQTNPWSQMAVDPRYAVGPGGNADGTSFKTGGSGMAWGANRASNRPSKKFGAPPPAEAAPAPPPPVVVIQPTPQAPIVQPQAPLADVNNIPALQQIREQKVMPAFGLGPTSFSEPGLGITDTPAPYLSASTFQAMAPDEQEDTLQLWEMLGMPRIKALFEMISATPGAKLFPQKAFGFA